ncbi:glucose 1-dehydrogenase [Macrococcus lamae]|uniref:Diacetyl reductase [(S)-acetoin forming] n=1 Tax=Macrococcus lamae TaxID=198484 RepID=A0A4R6BVA1_9STAP|nr:glucose 1-dehydrogenase [Macrococcus lamae]TDM12062.1 glucose 1-dehydrogenase [Macrococcus lamae]
MYNDLKDKVALVTGGSSGIGKAIVERFAKEGMKVAVNYHSDAEEAEKIVNKIKAQGGEAIAIKADTTKEEEFLAMFKTTIDTFGALHVMVNNAGIQKDIVSHEMTTEQFDQVMNVNLRGTFIGCREALKQFMKQKYKGNIINISSVHEIIPWPHYAQYCASKGGVKLLTQSLAMEYARVQIRINNIAPGSVDTPINAENFETEEKKKGAEDFVPMGYVAEPEEMANIAAFLASRESKYITGQTIVSDGGLSLYPSHRNWEYDELAAEFTDEI